MIFSTIFRTRGTTNFSIAATGLRLQNTMRTFSSPGQGAKECTICVFKHLQLPCNPCQYLLQPEKLSSTNYFDFFCLHSNRDHFPIDHSLLQQTYKKYQQVLHPDRFSSDQALLDTATQVSSFCSNAYRTLQDDVSRAKYMLKEEHGIEALTEGEREKNHELMEWVFETRLEIEEAEEESELQAILLAIQTGYDDKIKIITQLFEQGEFDRIKDEID